nr:metallophosphoesterase [uncultured Bacteroides sp.]
MIQRILAILAIALIIPDIYIYRIHIIRLTDSLFLRTLYFVPSLLLLAGLVFLILSAEGSFISQHSRWVGWFAVLFFLFTLPKILFMLCSLIGLPFKFALHWPQTPFIYAGLILAASLAGIILYGSFVGKTRFEVKEVNFASSKLPKAFNGYRIVQLSDIHIGSWEGNEKAMQEAVNKVNALNPDLIVFTGDLVNNRADELDGFQDILAKLKAKDGIYSILGNHDYGPYYRWKSKIDQAKNLVELEKRQKQLDWKLLNNSHAILHKANDSIALIGVENEGEPPFSQHGDLPRASEGTENMFQLLLSHNPTHWRREVLPKSNVDLMLAGHTHAMQMAWGHHSPSSFVYPEWSGMYKEGERGLYVNVGLGFVGIPFRFGAWPEITVITLQAN